MGVGRKRALLWMDAEEEISLYNNTRTGIQEGCTNMLYNTIRMTITKDPINHLAIKAQYYSRQVQACTTSREEFIHSKCLHSTTSLQITL
jgi:hypothetical protein